MPENQVFGQAEGGGRKRNSLYDMHYFYSSEYLSGN